MPSFLVTGASRGLGYAFIAHLASIPGNTVVGLVRNKSATASRLAAAGIKGVHLLAADVTDAAAVAAAAKEASGILSGKLDILIHNAALVSERSGFMTLLDDAGTPAELDADLQSSFTTNVIGTVHVVENFLPLVRAGSAKKIAVLSTGMADLDFIRQFDIAIAAPYTVSKAANNALVAKYHAALGKKEGVLIFSISPGLVDTNEGDPPPPEVMEGVMAMIKQFANYSPGFQGPISPEDSVKMCMQVISKATVTETGGKFISHYGNQQWL